MRCTAKSRSALLEFTPLEFETFLREIKRNEPKPLEFTPLEFETDIKSLKSACLILIRIYSVGV